MDAQTPPAGAAGHARAGRSVRAVLAAAALAVSVAACGSSTPASPAGTASAQPSATADGGASSVEPSGTPWPGNVPDAVIALGAFDLQMSAAAQAMDAAVTAEDLTALSGAAKGLVDLLDANAENVATVQGYEGTKGLGDAYAAAIAKMREGAQSIVDGVAKGDAAGVNTGVKGMSAGVTEYGLARRALAPLLEQAISMKKKYVK